MIYYDIILIIILVFYRLIIFDERCHWKPAVMNATQALKQITDKPGKGNSKKRPINPRLDYDQSEKRARQFLQKWGLIWYFCRIRETSEKNKQCL